MKTRELIYLIIICILIGCTVRKQSKPCKQCPQYSETIKRLEIQHKEDSIALGILNTEYYELWDENQIFSSMLGEIELSKNGDIILKKLYDEKRN